MVWVPPEFRSGRYPTGADIEDIANQIASLTSGWQDYTPTWGADGTAPALGNGTLTGTYRWPNESDLVHVQVRWLAGTTTTYGTSFFHFTLPVVAAGFDQLIGFGNILDAGTIRRPCSTHVKSTTQLYIDSDGGSVTSTVPHTWANTDEIVFNVFYRPA